MLCGQGRLGQDAFPPDLPDPDGPVTGKVGALSAVYSAHLVQKCLCYSSHLVHNYRVYSGFPHSQASGTGMGTGILFPG